MEKEMIEKDVTKTTGFQAADMYEQFMVPYVFRPLDYVSRLTL